MSISTPLALTLTPFSPASTPPAGPFASASLPASPSLPGDGVVRHPSPLGPLLIRVARGRITELEIDTAQDPGLDAPAPGRVHDEARRQLDAYFAGLRRTFALPLAPAGTEFQGQVWRALEGVPWGTATSYGDLACRTGRPTGARAVGGAIRANRVALLVPCHRVLGAGGRLTGYSAGRGVPTKRWLLEHEGIEYRESAAS